MYAILLLPLLVAHPYHVSVAEMEFNPRAQRWEVALRLHPGDLNAALSRQQQRRVILEREPPEAARRMAIEYLAPRFRLFAADASAPKEAALQVVEPQEAEQAARVAAKLHWVGMEIQPKFVWWYFELEPPAGNVPLQLENRVLMEIERTQVNTVNVLGGGQLPSLLFTIKQSVHACPSPGKRNGSVPSEGEPQRHEDTKAAD